MNKFYSDTNFEVEKHVTLNADESKHAIAVLRLKIDDGIMLLNGKGSKALAVITVANKNACEVSIKNVENLEIRPDFTLLISPPKSTDRWEYIVEKSQELNVSCLQPVITKHSERKKINLDKAQNIARAALKQSGAFYECVVKDFTPFNKAIEQYKAGLFGYCNMLNISSVSKKPCNSIFIGPEGDFSEEEVLQLMANDWHTFKLSNNILRSETAAIAAIVKHNPFL